MKCGTTEEINDDFPEVQCGSRMGLVNCGNSHANRKIGIIDMFIGRTSFQFF